MSSEENGTICKTVGMGKVVSSEVDGKMGKKVGMGRGEF